MAGSGDSWVREYNEAVKLADDISNMISERSALPATGPDAQRHSSAIRRKITILGTRLDSLLSLVSKQNGRLPLGIIGDSWKGGFFTTYPASYKILTVLLFVSLTCSACLCRTEKEMNRRRDMIANLRSKANQMASKLNMSNFANRDSLLGPETKPVEAMTRANGLDSQGIASLQRQVMKEQDEDLEKLEETVISTKHIALAVNEELDLHTRLIDTLDEHIEVTDSRLQRVQRRLAILNKRTKGGCSCLCLLSSVIGIVVLVALVYLLIRYL